MYIKFVFNSQGTEQPRQFLVEADLIEYSIQVVDESWQDRQYAVLGLGPQMGEQAIVLGRCPPGETLIATRCSMYVMNNEGRTIDSLVCP